MIELKRIADGGMDLQSASEDVAPNDYREAYNFRNTGSVGEDEKIGTNIEETEEVMGERPDGLNKCIGGGSFETIRELVYFIYNSNQQHLLAEYNYDTETETILYTDKIDSAGVELLKLNPQYFVSGCKLVQNKFLIFNDANNGVGYVNLDRLRDGSYGTLTEDDFSLIKAAPLIVPTAVYGNDGGRSVNLLRGNLFQFILQWQGFDDEFSVFSSFSKREVPIDEGTPAIGTDVAMANHMAVTVDIGTNRVKTLYVGARNALLYFVLIKSIDRADILAITDTDIDLEAEIYEAYDPGNNTYTFLFYNDGQYISLDPLETDLAYDYVPKKVNAIEVLPGNILSLWGITEGYTRPNPDVSIIQTSYDPQIRTEVEVDSEAFSVYNWVEQKQPNASYRKVRIYFKGVVQTGDKLTLTTENLVGVPYEDSATTYTCPIGEDEDTFEFIKSFALLWPYPNSVVVEGDYVVLRFSTRRESETPSGSREKFRGFVIELANVGNGISKSMPGIKTNSSYQVMMYHKTKHGVDFPINTGNKYIVKTQSLAQLKGLTPKITWTINNENAPADAAVYGFGLSFNNTHDKTLYINGVLDETNTNSDYLVFKINSLQKFNRNNSSSILAYDYAAGDRATFVCYLDVDGNPVWYDVPPIDTEVVAMDIVKTESELDEETEVDYLLKIRKSASIDQADIEGKNILLEVYSPKLRTETVEGVTTSKATVFFEIGEQYPIVNGKYTKLTGDITSGDIFYKTRTYTNAVDINTADSYIVEDFNFSDYYQSNYTSYGRARTYDDVSGEDYLKASVRYSSPFLLGSRVNGMTRFYKERIYGEGPGETSSNYGAFKNVMLRDNYIVAIQELKDAHVPFYSRIIEDNEGAQSVAISDKIFGNVRYIESGKWGMGNSNIITSRQNGTIYFVDTNNSLPIRDGYDGVGSIAGKLEKFFKRVIQLANKQGKQITLTYDNYNDELLLSIETDGDILVIAKFTASQWQEGEYYTVNAGTITITDAPDKGTLGTIVDGIALFTPTTGEIGPDGITFTFTNSLGNLITKNVCLTILDAATVVDGFFFIDVVDADLSTEYISNPVLISGNPAPAPVSIVGGTYSINGGAFTSAAGLAYDGDEIKVKRNSSNLGETTVDVVLTVGAVSDTFSITTEEIIAVAVPINWSNVEDADMDSSIEFYVNSVLTDTGTGTSSGVFNGAFSGDTVEIRQVAPITWTDTGTATLTLDKNGDFQQKSTATYASNLQSFTFVADAADIISVSARTEPSSVALLLSALVVDLIDKPNLNVIAFIDNAEITGNHTAIYTGQNFLPIGVVQSNDPDTGLPYATPRYNNAYILGSDRISPGGTSDLDWRFEFNLAKLINDYPATDVFTFYIKGRNDVIGTVNMPYSMKGASSSLQMSGGVGTYTPGIANDTNIYSGSLAPNIVSGANGSFLEADLTNIAKFVYTVSTNTLVPTGY